MSIDFDPVKVSRGRRRADPLRIAVLAVFIALGVAIVKPWEQGGVPGARPPTVAAARASAGVPGPSPAPAAASRVVPRDPFRGAPPPTWAALAPVVAGRDTWGVRAIIVSWRGFQPEPRPLYVEHWTRTAPTPLGIDTAYVTRDNRSIVALGITFPSGLNPTYARVWRVHANDELEWIDARPLGRGEEEGAFLYLRFDLAGVRAVAWDAGLYRIDVLVDGNIRRISVEVPDPSGTVPAPDDWPAT